MLILLMKPFSLNMCKVRSGPDLQPGQLRRPSPRPPQSDRGGLLDGGVRGAVQLPARPHRPARHQDSRQVRAGRPLVPADRPALPTAPLPRPREPDTGQGRTDSHWYPVNQAAEIRLCLQGCVSLCSGGFLTMKLIPGRP